MTMEKYMVHLIGASYSNSLQGEFASEEEATKEAMEALDCTIDEIDAVYTV